MGHKKNKTVQQNKTKVSNQTSEYDLPNNLKKFESYNPFQSRKAINISIQTCNFNPKEDNGNLTNNSEISGVSTQTESGLPSLSYSKLDDKITNLTTANNNAHTELRRELESKIQATKSEIEGSITEIKSDIKDKLSNQWYIWTIGGLVAIVGVFISFSYIPLNNRVSSCENKIQRLDSCEHINKKDIEYIKTDQSELKQSVDYLKTKKR